MICIHCRKKINTSTEKYETFGCDGDFIHKDCREDMNKNMDKVLNASDEQFINWLRGGDI